jgi:tetratricopeptide (TPR) repeat protein/tRNA A-37 threonylcarbamoyl transferase component Bud32
MNPQRPSPYEQLTLEAAARVDAVCDGFEKAWKAARSGAAPPHLSSFLDGCEEPERTVLAGELLALDGAWRERYRLAVGPETSNELGAEHGVAPAFSTDPLRSRSLVPACRLADWPSIPGLELVEVLGSGGMGVVFKARQSTLDRDVAVKFLRDDHQADPARRERFLQEARAIARLRHPNLVQVYEFGEVHAAGGAASQPYLVLEYVSGGSLAKLLRGSPQPPKEAARLVETLADAIHYAHQQGVIHRDLKPANVLIADCGLRIADSKTSFQSAIRNPQSAIPKITDFGLAKFLAGSGLTQSGDVLGTPSYMAPEQADGNSGPITTAVDVYGLGAILYEALTGRPPFAAETAVATLVLVRQDEPVPPRRLQPTVPSDLETICLKCLRKEAGRRYATAQDLADDLRRFRAGEPVRARPVGMGERVVGWCRRKPGVAGLLAALVLVFLAGVIGVLWQWQRANRKAAEAEQNAAAFQRERDTARQEKARAEQRLQMVCDRVERLTQLGRDMMRRPGLYRTGQDVLEEALAFYRQMLPEEGNDPRVRREAAKLFRQVAEIHHHIGQLSKAAEAYGHQVDLLSRMLNEDTANKALRMDLAYAHRWQGNELRDLGKAREARKAYNQAARLHETLLSESPHEARCQMALANTLLNITTLLSHRGQVEERKTLYRRILKLYRTAVQAAPDDVEFNTELALGLQSQGLFLLDTGQGSQAEGAVREALKIHQRLRASGRPKGAIERYTARSFACLGRVLAATGRADEAEKSYREAVSLLDRSMDESPESALYQAALAQTLAALANLLDQPGRRQETADIHRRVIRLYEKLKADFPENSRYRRNLAQSYLELARLLCELGQPTEAAEPYRKALEMDSDDPDLNNNLAWFLATRVAPPLRDPARAVRLAKKAVAARPRSGDYRNTLGVALYRNGDDRAALAELETSMSLRDGGDSFDWFFLAMAHWRLGERDKAQTWFDRAVLWMDSYRPHNHELRRFRAEADAMLAEAPRH